MIRTSQLLSLLSCVIAMNAGPNNVWTDNLWQMGSVVTAALVPHGCMGFMGAHVPGALERGDTLRV